MRLLKQGSTVAVLAVCLSAAGLAESKGRPDKPAKAIDAEEARPLPARRLDGSLAPPYQGSRIILDSEAEGDALRFQQAFAEAFSRRLPEPESRSAHFAWLPKQIHVKGIVSPGSVRFEWVPNAEPNVWRIGWNGSITKAAEQPDGSARVTVKIQPSLYSTNFKTLMADYVMETYRFADGRIELVATDAATPRRNLQGFPIMN